MLFDLQHKQNSWQGINVLQTVFNALADEENRRVNTSCKKVPYLSRVSEKYKSDENCHVRNSCSQSFHDPVDRYLHCGPLMKTVAPFCTITGHRRELRVHAQICFNMLFWSERLSGSSLFIRGWQSYFIENGKVTANWFYSDTDGETMNVPSIQSAI